LLIPYHLLFQVGAHSFLTATLPHTSSPLACTNTLKLSAKHPHAQKQSILNGQISLDHIFPTTSIPPAPFTPNSSTSSFTLALDPIAEGAQFPYLSSPTLSSHTVDTMFLLTQQNTVAPSNHISYLPPPYLPRSWPATQITSQLPSNSY
jgi:RAB6A-GEF complex partner protein 2